MTTAKRKTKSKSPTKRALDDLKALGFQYQVVERWNPFARVRQDLFGVIDIIGVLPGFGILGIQATSGDNHAARRTKSLSEPRLRTWLEGGGRFEVWSYSKCGPRGKPKRWELRREEIRLADMPPVVLVGGGE